MVLFGPRQCGKTTLARELLPAASPNYFDLEEPAGLARLDEPMTALATLRGLVVIDEVQRRPDLFPILRVLVDRKRQAARFLILGSASRGPSAADRRKPGRPNGAGESLRFLAGGARPAGGGEASGCAAAFHSPIWRGTTGTAPAGASSSS